MTTAQLIAVGAGLLILALCLIVLVYYLNSRNHRDE